MNRRTRRILRRCGLDVAFDDVVCTSHAKIIRVADDSRIEVVVDRSLVFLDEPSPVDLRDVLPSSDEDGPVPYESPDARELLRTTGRNSTVIYWAPREPIVPYTLYRHQYAWSSTASHIEAALYSEFHCDVRTGLATLEITTPGGFEAAVAFQRPRWHRLGTEQRLVRYALAQLERREEQPQIVDSGCRLTWKIIGPRVGERHVCVGFHMGGLAQWQQRLEASSLAGRMRRLIKPIVSA